MFCTVANKMKSWKIIGVPVVGSDVDSERLISRDFDRV